MRVSVKGRVDDEAEFTLKRRLNALRMAKDAVRKVSFAVERRLKTPGQGIPVDTGRARASWGRWTPQHLRAGAKDASAKDAVWEESDGGLTIEQGSNVEYIRYLNDGTSKMPALGFIEAAEEAGSRELEKEIDSIMASF